MRAVAISARTRKLTVTGILGGISILLGATPLGFIPVGLTKATIMHIPVIIGAILEGPAVGALVGLIFGVFSMIQALVAPTSPVYFVFLNPLVAVLPRVLIGLVAYFVFRYTRSTILTAVAGTLTNTVGVLFMIYALYAADFAKAIGQDPALAGKIIAGIGLTNGLPEIGVAVLIVVPVIKALKKFVKA